MHYFWSDPHFGHKRIQEYCPGRPGKTVDEMNEILIDNFNNVVGPNDTVWCLGDFAFMPKTEVMKWVQKLNGINNLVLGNHDLHRPPAFWEDAGFNKAFKLGYGKTVTFREPAPESGNENDWCAPLFEMCHYPVYKALAAYDVREYLHPHAPKQGQRFLVHGHVHDRWKFRDRMINVGVDVWDYKPVSLNELLVCMRHIEAHGAPEYAPPSEDT